MSDAFVSTSKVVPMCAGVECGQKRFGGTATARDATGERSCRPRCARVTTVSVLLPFSPMAVLRVFCALSQAKVLNCKKDLLDQREKLTQVSWHCFIDLSFCLFKAAHVIPKHVARCCWWWLCRASMSCKASWSQPKPTTRKYACVYASQRACVHE